MNVEKLKRLQAQVRIGGKGTPRRKKKVTHQTAAADDKKLQSSLKKLSVSTIPGIEEVNIIKDDLTVIHFNNPKVQASLSANTFAVTGHGETKKVVEMLPEILPHLGQETVVQLRLFANSMTNNQKIDESREEKFKSTLHSNDDNDVPMLVSNFDEIAKSEDLTTEKLEKNSVKILSLEDNALKSDVAQDIRLNIINSNDRKKVLTLNSDVNIEANSDFKYNNEIVLLTESAQNKDQSHKKDDNFESEVKSDKKDTQFLKNYTKSSFKDKKNSTHPSAEQKDKGTKKGSNLKKAKEAHQENKNKSDIIDFKEYVSHLNADENILSMQNNSVAMGSEIDLQDQNNTKKTIKELKEDTLIFENIAHTEVNTIQSKQLNIIVNLDAKKNAEAKCTSKNEIHNNYEKLSPDVSIGLEFNNTENNDTMNSINSIIKELRLDVNLTTKEIEPRNLEEKNQSIKIKPLVSNEFIAKEKNPNDAGREKEKLNEKPPPSCALLKMDEVDLNPKDMAEKKLPLNQILEQSSIMTHLQSKNVFDMNKTITTDLLLNSEEKTDGPIINKTINNEIQEIETLQKPLEQAASTTFPQVTKTDGEQTKEIINKDKIQTEILQEPPEDATPSLTTALNVTETNDKQTKEVPNENKMQTEVFKLNSKISYGIDKNEKKPDEVQENELLKTQNLSAESPLKIKIEQKSQQTCGLKSRTSPITIDQNMEKSINLDECSVTEERKNDTKADEIQENENNNQIIRAQDISAEMHVVTGFEQKLQQIRDLKNSEILDQHKETYNLSESSITEECATDTNQDIVRALATVMSTEKTSSEKKIENNATSPKAGKQPAPKRNETKPGTSAKTSTYSKNADIGVKSKQMSPPKIQTDIRFIPKTQKLPKTASITSVKPEKQVVTQKTKQQLTVPFKAQKTIEIKARSLTQPPTKQNISLLTKGSTEISIKTATTECLANVPTDKIVDQTPSTLEKPTKSLSSAKTATKKNDTTDQTSATTDANQKQQNLKEKQMKSTDISTKPVTIQSAVAEPTNQLIDQTLSTAGKKKTRDQIPATTGTNQKQPKPKVKQVKSLFGKPEPTSTTSQPKSKSSKPVVDLNKNTS